MTRITLVSLIATFVLMLVVLELVRRRRLQERYSVLWLLTSGCLFLLAAWSSLLSRISDSLGIRTPSNALFVVAAGFFLAVLLHFSIAMSRLSEQCSRLAQRLAMLEERTAVRGPQPRITIL